jgi:D-ala D-ala ligase C-terminus
MGKPSGWVGISSRASADKAACSGRLAEAVATPRQKVVSRGSTYTLGVRATLPRIAVQLGAHGAAGPGVRIVDDIEVVPAAVLSAFNYDESIVIESAISGREYTVLVSGDKEELWGVGHRRGALQRLQFERRRLGPHLLARLQSVGRGCRAQPRRRGPPPRSAARASPPSTFLDENGIPLK